MYDIKVLGSGCKKCTKAAEIIEKKTSDMKLAASVTKETSPELIMQYGVMKTPAVIVNDKLVHSGPIPTEAEITSWFK